MENTNQQIKTEVIIIEENNLKDFKLYIKKDFSYWIFTIVFMWIFPPLSLLLLSSKKGDVKILTKIKIKIARLVPHFNYYYCKIKSSNIKRDVLFWIVIVLLFPFSLLLLKSGKLSDDNIFRKILNKLRKTEIKRDIWFYLFLLPSYFSLLATKRGNQSIIDKLFFLYPFRLFKNKIFLFSFLFSMGLFFIADSSQKKYFTPLMDKFMENGIMEVSFTYNNQETNKIHPLIDNNTNEIRLTFSNKQLVGLQSNSRFLDYFNLTDYSSGINGYEFSFTRNDLSSLDNEALDYITAKPKCLNLISTLKINIKSGGNWSHLGFWSLIPLMLYPDYPIVKADGTYDADINIDIDYKTITPYEWGDLCNYYYGVPIDINHFQSRPYIPRIVTESSGYSTFNMNNVSLKIVEGILTPLNNNFNNNIIQNTPLNEKSTSTDIFSGDYQFCAEECESFSIRNISGKFSGLIISEGDTIFVNEIKIDCNNKFSFIDKYGETKGQFIKNQNGGIVIQFSTGNRMGILLDYEKNNIFDNTITNIIVQYSDSNYHSENTTQTNGIVDSSDVTSEEFAFPNQIGYVNDFESDFSLVQISELNKIISQHEKSTTNEISVVTIETFEPYKTLSDYSLDLANNWGVGKKDKNNGVMVVLGKGIRQIRIQVGKGLEGKLTNEETQNIINSIIVPELKKGDYFNGVRKGVLAVINEIK